MEAKQLKMIDPVEMGHRIRTEREFMNMTREDLSGKLGVSTKFISDIEYGQKGMSIKTLYLISQILDVSTDYILSGTKRSEGEENEKTRLKEYILEPLKDCNIEQLRCMEKISKYYVEGLKQK